MHGYIVNSLACIVLTLYNLYTSLSLVSTVAEPFASAISCECTSSSNSPQISPVPVTNRGGYHVGEMFCMHEVHGIVICMHKYNIQLDVA